MKGRAFRIDRRRGVPSGYSGWTHLAVITGVCLASTALFLYFLGPMVWWHYLVLPVSFVVANFVEYCAHRWPMHHPVRNGFFKHIYKQHAGIHHRYFTYENMVLDDPRDLREILSTPRHISGFLLMIVVPTMAFLSLMSWNIGLLFGATSIMYYLFYEWVHLASHMPPNHWIPSLPVLRGLCHHHKEHHQTRLMREYNFNIAFPLFDYVFGTKA